MKNGIDDGIIKYDRSNFTQSTPLNYSEYEETEAWRKILFKLNLIGEYPIEKVGFGNMSQAKDYGHFCNFLGTQFVITGTQTGKHPHLNGEHYTRVLAYDIEAQKIHVNGPLEASSEALTHAALYDANTNIKSVFHIHSKEIWQGMIRDNLPATSENIPYGTKEMANAVNCLVRSTDEGMICMKGHDDGVIIYANSCDRAGELTLALYLNYVANEKFNDQSELAQRIISLKNIT